MGHRFHGGKYGGCNRCNHSADSGETHVPCGSSKLCVAVAGDCGEEEIKRCHDSMIEQQDSISASLKSELLCNTKKAGLIPANFLTKFIFFRSYTVPSNNVLPPTLIRFTPGSFFWLKLKLSI